MQSFYGNNMENNMERPQKIKRTTIWSSYTFGYLSKEYENTHSKRYMHPYVHCSIIYNNQDMKQPKSCQHVDKKDLVSIQNTA